MGTTSFCLCIAESTLKSALTFVEQLANNLVSINRLSRGFAAVIISVFRNLTATAAKGKREFKSD
jgi:hypothetical protein